MVAEIHGVPNSARAATVHVTNKNMDIINSVLCLYPVEEQW